MPVSNIMEDPFPEVQGSASANKVFNYSIKIPERLINYNKDESHIITLHDIIDTIK